MKEIWVIGASKFAMDVSTFIEAALGREGVDYRHCGFLWVEGEEMAADPDITRPFSAEMLSSSRVVVAVSDLRARARLFAGHHAALRESAVNIIHPSAMLAKGCQIGAGNIIGPHCYIGVNSRIGDFNVLNYQIGIGHHSQLGDANFLAPGFQCGNTVNIGNSNFFGLSCAVGPGLAIGNSNRFQAGAVVTQPVANDLLCFSSERMKAVQLPQEVVKDAAS
jgi:UDP-3-O-[3-hydroxymyristoyl] glucosamine N-acyltransferase